MDWSNDQKAQEGLGPRPHAAPAALVHGVEDGVPFFSNPLSLILPLMMMPKVVLENLGKIVRFCYSALYSPS